MSFLSSTSCKYHCCPVDLPITRHGEHLIYYHYWKLISCRQGRKQMCCLINEILSAYLRFYQHTPNYAEICLIIYVLCHNFFFQSAGFPSDPFPTHLSLHLGGLLLKQMVLRREEKPKVKQLQKTVFHTNTSFPNSRTKSRRGNTHR